LRARWRALLGGDAPPDTPVLIDAVEAGLRRLDEDPSPELDHRADRRILRRAHTGLEVGRALSRRFHGAILTADHAMTAQESLDTLLVPSNQEEYLPEIDDDTTRAAVIEELLLGEVLPALNAGPAGTENGLNIRWTFGDLRRRGD